jgi:hypothetical protein
MQLSELTSKLAQESLADDSEAMRSTSTSEFEEREVLAGCINPPNSRREVAGNRDS